MTSDEALRQLKQAFPGKDAYVESMRWIRNGELEDYYTFNVCVYLTNEKNAQGHYETAHGSSDDCLADAVRQVLAKAPNKVDAEAMFAGATS